jgi:CHAD domain-containing protein
MIDLAPVLLARLQRFQKRLQHLQCDANPVAVHEFRIACRELLACWPLLQDVGSTQAWRKPVRKAMKALDALRDLQQLQMRLTGEILWAVPVEEYRVRAQRRWQNYQPKIHSAAFTGALHTSGKRLQKMDETEKVLLLETWQRQWRRKLSRVRKRLDVVEAADVKTLHRLRIRYKYLRYLLELLLEAGATLDVDAAALKYWQDILGDIEDYRVMAQLVEKMSGPASLQQQFAQLAAEKAIQFMKQRNEFAQFLSALEQQVFHYFA